MINQDQIILSNLLKIKKYYKEEIIRDSEEIKKEEDEINKSELTDIKWIWPWTVKLLKENWINNVSELRAASESKLTQIIKNPLSLKGILNFINNSK